MNHSDLDCFFQKKKIYLFVCIAIPLKFRNILLRRYIIQRVPDINGQTWSVNSVRVNREKVLYRHRSFETLLKSYDKNMKYEGNSGRLTVIAT